MNFGAKTMAAGLLGPTEFGYVALFFATSVVVNQLADGGITRGTIQLIATARGREGNQSVTGRRMARTSFAFALIGTFVTLLVATVMLATPHGRDPRRLLTACGVLTGGVLALIATERAITQGFERFRLTALTLCAAPAVTFLTLVGMRVSHAEPRAGYVALAYLIPAIAIAVCFAAVAGHWTRGVRISRADWRLVARFGGIFTLAAVFEGIGGQSDVLVLSWLRPAADVGVYGAAATFASIVPLLSNTVNTYFGPRLTAVAARGDDDHLHLLYVDSVALMSFVGLMGLAGIFGALPVLLPALLGTKFQAAVELFPWLLPSIAVLVVHATSGAIFMARQRNDLIVKVAVTLVTVTLLAHLVLVPILGTRGAALGMLAGQLASITISWSQIARLLKRGPPMRLVLAMAAYASVTVLLLRLIGIASSTPVISLCLQILAGAILFLAGWRVFQLNQRLHRDTV